MGSMTLKCKNVLCLESESEIATSVIENTPSGEVYFETFCWSCNQETEIAYAGW